MLTSIVLYQNKSVFSNLSDSTVALRYVFLESINPEISYDDTSLILCRQLQHDITTFYLDKTVKS